MDLGATNTSSVNGLICYNAGLGHNTAVCQRPVEMFDEYFTGRIFAFDQLAAVEYAAIVLQRERTGSPISMPDAQIAAICRVSIAGLATRNTKDFDNTGLVRINPWQA